MTTLLCRLVEWNSILSGLQILRLYFMSYEKIQKMASSSSLGATCRNSIDPIGLPCHLELDDCTMDLCQKQEMGGKSNL